MQTELPVDHMASSGIPGLDDILTGGYLRNRLYLIEGTPGSGKTTLAMQFLMAAAARGEPVLYVTLSESEHELRALAISHNWSLDGIDIRELNVSEGELDPDEQNTMFHPSELELATTTRRILDDIERVRPAAVVFDSLSELRLLAGGALRYRRQILAFKHLLATRDCTVLLLDDTSDVESDMQMQSLAHAVIRLEHRNPEYGSERRRLRVVKYRGIKFRGGYHDLLIRKGGLVVFPRLVAAEHRASVPVERLSSGVPELDTLLGGGLEAGTSTLIVGAAGTGKSTIAAQFVVAAASRGVASASFLFDENPHTLIGRCDAIGIDLSRAQASGQVSLQQVDPAELTPGELIHAMRVAVEEQGVRIIVVDSLNGYLSAMPEERFLAIQLHELLMYLGQRGVATIMVAAHHGLIGPTMSTPVDASYLADAVILMRYFELKGEVRQAISVVKKRGGHHERTIREFAFTAEGIQVGRALREFRGVLTGVPIYEGPFGAGDQQR